jgi:hypothetical protein
LQEEAEAEEEEEEDEEVVCVQNGLTQSRLLLKTPAPKCFRLSGLLLSGFLLPLGLSAVRSNTATDATEHEDEAFGSK